MATVSLDGNGRVIVTFADGIRFQSSEKITKDTVESKAIGIVQKAINGADRAYKDKGAELDQINVPAEARRLLAKLKEPPVVKVEPAARVSTPAPPVVAAPKPQPVVVTPPQPAPPLKKEVKVQPAPSPRKVARRPPPGPVRRAPPVEPPKPRIDRTVILAQIGTRDQATAATFLVSNSDRIDDFLKAGQKGTERTRTQREATIRLFNELSRIPAFGLYLSSVANEKEFAELEMFLGQHRGNIDNVREAQILAYADLYIRYYLVYYAAKDPNFRNELIQLERFKKTGKDDLLGPIDSDTIAAAELHIRRWNPKTPLKSDLPAWTSPEAVPELKPRRIAIIGASSVGDDRKHPTILGSTLQKLAPRTIVESYGNRGENLTQMAARFKRDIIDGGQKYDIVIISAGAFVNNPIYTLATSALELMIKQAKEAGIRVIVTGVMPYGGYKGCDKEKWKKAEDLNGWLQDKAREGQITYVDLRSLGDNNNPPRLRPEFTSPGSDGLHSDLAREETAMLIVEELRATDPAWVRATRRVRLETGTGTSERETPLDRAWDRATGPTALPQPPRIEPTPLMIFAELNWQTLREKLAQAVQEKNPAEILKLATTLPQGQSSLEKALADLNRNDIQLAFRDVFRSLNEDNEFKAFVRKGRYNLFNGKNLIELPEGTSIRDLATVRLASRAVQEYMRSKVPNDADFEGDIRHLQDRRIANGVLGSAPENLILTLGALAVYKWRLDNPNKPIGEWGKTWMPAEPSRKTVIF